MILEIWRTLFGEIVVGDLEKSCSAFWRIRSVILEIVMEYRNASVTVRGDRKLKGKMETNYGDQNFIHHKMESTYLERFKGRNV